MPSSSSAPPSQGKIPRKSLTLNGPVFGQQINPGSNLSGNRHVGPLPCCGDAAQAVNDVKVVLIKREWLDRGRIVLKDRMDLLRDGAVDVEPRRDKHELGTPPHRNRRRHYGANPKAPRFVTRRSPGSRSPPDDFEIQVIALLDTRRKCPCQREGSCEPVPRPLEYVSRFGASKNVSPLA